MRPSRLVAARGLEHARAHGPGPEARDRRRLVVGSVSNGRGADDGYEPIREYGFLSDCHSVALGVATWIDRLVLHAMHRLAGGVRSAPGCGPRRVVLDRSRL